MGLTLHYALRLPGSIHPDHIDRLLADLHSRARSLSFEAVSSIVQTAEPIVGRPAGFLRLMGEIISEPFPEIQDEPAGQPESGRGFLIDVGAGCEPATIAFLSRGSGDAREWFWRCHCKTQYASSVSEAHFIKCHVGLVTLLDRARELGVDVEVHDEGEYWEKRDETQLVAEVRRWNQLMARFAGRLADVLGDKHDVVAPIFERRDFEHLEMGE